MQEDRSTADFKPRAPSLTSSVPALSDDSNSLTFKIPGKTPIVTGERAACTLHRSIIYGDGGDGLC